MPFKKGNVPPNKGKTWEEAFGVERGSQIRQKISKGNKGKKSPKKGKTFEEQFGVEKAGKIRKKISDHNCCWNKDKTSKDDPRIPSGKNHSCYGKPSKLKGKTWEDLYGSERAKEKKKRNSKRMKNFHRNKKHRPDCKCLTCKPRSGKDNPLYGKPSPKKGKTYEEFYGEQRGEQMRKELSQFKTGVPHTENCQCPFCKAHRGDDDFIPWNKDVSSEDDSRVLAGKEHPMYGRNHTPEVCEKMSEEFKGIRRSPETEFKKGLVPWNFDEDFYNKYGTTKSKYPYSKVWTDNFKKQIRNLYDNRCVVTEMTNEDHIKKYGRNLTVHHILYDKDETNPFYFVPVTLAINNQANRNKAQWIDLFWHIAEDKWCELV